MATSLRRRPPGVGHLEGGDVAEEGQPGLRASLAGVDHPVVGEVEEPLQLRLGQGPLGRAALEVLGVGGGVPLEADLGRVVAEALLADLRPEVPRVAHVLEELADGALVAAHRGKCLGVVATPKLGAELLEILGQPRPWVVVGVALEAADVRLPVLDRRPVQVPGELLVPPALQHRLKTWSAG
jgi:hypothetical protein